MTADLYGDICRAFVGSDFRPRLHYLHFFKTKPTHPELQDSWHNISGCCVVAFGSFDVNLRCEDNDSGNIAMHINPRFEGWDKVVFNSFEEGSWGSEDKVWSMPFSKGEGFELVIRTTSEGYQVRLITSPQIAL